MVKQSKLSSLVKSYLPKSHKVVPPLNGTKTLVHFILRIKEQGTISLSKKCFLAFKSRNLIAKNVENTKKNPKFGDFGPWRFKSHILDFSSSLLR